MLLTNSTRAFSVWVKALKTSDQAFSCFLVFFFLEQIERKKRQVQHSNIFVTCLEQESKCLFVCFFKNLSLGFIRNNLKFRRFQPRYSYKIMYIYTYSFFVHFLFRTQTITKSKWFTPLCASRYTVSGRFLVLLQQSPSIVFSQQERYHASSAGHTGG